MANTSQATKRAIQNQKRALHNTSQRSALRTTLKKTLQLIRAKDPEVQKLFQKTVSLIDRTASHGVIHPNKAARLKSRLHKKLKSQT